MTINTSIKIKLLSKRITLQLNKKGYHELNSTITANNFIKEKEKKKISIIPRGATLSIKKILHKKLILKMIFAYILIK